MQVIKFSPNSLSPITFLQYKSGLLLFYNTLTRRLSLSYNILMNNITKRPKQTSIRADSGDRGFPSSQTTKSETSSTTPAHQDNLLLHPIFAYFHVTPESVEESNNAPLFNRTGIPCLRKNGSISCVNCSRGPSGSSTWDILEVYTNYNAMNISCIL